MRMLKAASLPVVVLALLLTGVTIAGSGCVVAPVGPYGYEPGPYYAVPPPVVVAPAPVFMFGRGGHRHWR